MSRLFHTLSMDRPGKAVLNASDTTPPHGSFYRERRPAVPGSVVACWWEQRAGAGGHVQRVLPDACADVIVLPDGQAVVVGPATSVRLPRLAAGDHLRGLRLRSAAIGAALGLPAAELRDIQVPLRDLFPALPAARLADQVRRGAPPTALRPGGPDPRVQGALAALRRPASRVAGVAGALGMSERHLRRLVLEHTGLDPRTYQRVARFQRFLAGADRGAPSLAHLAADSGYADQAHLSREVRALSGLTPSRLLAERRAAALEPRGGGPVSGTAS
jgi:methylphosphotriester-DNA--protein-cysteine methyltransferase